VLVATDGACALQTELALLSAAGFTNGELLSMATIGASRAVGRERDFGSIAVGKRADLVLIDGDPLANLSSLKNVTAVMKDGILYSNVDSLRADRPFLLPRR
jgi:imidazolonepropionase-like amidohydrolase